ncbi:MAG: ATP-binding protein [bacterium]
MKTRLSRQIHSVCRFPVSLIVLLFGMEAGIFSQQYFTRTYSEVDGLSSSMVFDAEQDSTGQIWFATRSGISSYDGHSWHNYSVTEGLNPSSYIALKVDAKGEIWALPQKGELCVVLFNDSTWESYACKPTQKITGSFTAFDVSYDKDEVVLAIGTSQSGFFIFQKGRWNHFTMGNGLSGNRVNGVQAIGDQVYVATDKGISLIRNSSVNNDLNQLYKFPTHDIHAIAIEQPVDLTGKNTKIWLLSDGWLGVIQDNKFSVKASGFHLIVTEPPANAFIHPDRTKGVYFGNTYYLYYLPPEGRMELLGRQKGLVSEGATSVFTDRENNIWITGLRGITRIPSKRFSGYTTSDGLLDNEVASALEISSGKYIFGHHGGLTILENGKFRHLNLDPGGKMPPQEMRVQDMALDGSGNLWLAVSYLGLARMDNQERIRWYRKEQGLEGNVVSVCPMPDGKIYATNDKNLYELNTFDNKFRLLSRRKNKDSGIRKLFPGNGDTLYLATFTHGLIARVKDKEYLHISRESRSSNSIYAFFEDSKHQKWVGTADGLFFVKDTILERFQTNQFAIHRPVYLILEDRLGRMWYGTDNGIYRWDNHSMEHFTIHQGLSGHEINRDAGIVDHLGRLWFGTNNGLTLYREEYDDDKHQIPPPLISLSTLEVNGKSRDLNAKQILGSRENNLLFNFRAVSFIDETRIYYQCKLEGFDSDWSKEFLSPENQFRYTNLHPGKYRFCIKARNAIGIWSEPVCSAEILIRHPFWLQWWFLLLLTAAIALGLSFGVRFLVIKRYNLRLSKMVAIRTRELRRSEKDLQESNASKDKFFSIIAHDLKSPFNSILGMLDLLTTEYQEFSDEERQKILLSLKTTSGRTIDLLENLLTWAQAQKGLLPFHPEKFDLKELIDENYSLFESSAKAKQIILIKPPPENMVVFADRNMINTVIRNLISNAIKFSFSESNVKLNWSRLNHKEVMVSVVDTGMGIPGETLKNLFNIDKKTTTKGTGNETGTGLGLILSRDFVQKNKGRMWVESQEGSGSTFFFTLPSS